ncbi:MAG: oligosaccharide flippase family protein [Planctomycetes bacterium]|nr:oligosaccharide flippase family protein [Planctomycetota bacterium]
MSSEPADDLTAAADGGPSEASPSLRSRAWKATLWTGVATVGARGLGLVGNLVMTRILLPEAFGLMALATVVLQLLQMLSDLGVEPAAVRSPRIGDPRFLDTAWTVQIARELLLTAVACALAWPASVFYDQPELSWLVPVAALGMLLGGFNSTSLFVLNRELAQRELTLREIGSQFVALVVMVGWALVSPTVWALLAGGIARQAAMLVIGHRLGERRRHSFAWEPEAVHEIVHFGKWIFLSSAIGFLASRADPLLMKKFVPIGVVGIYNVAFMLQNIPQDLVNNVAGRVAFPALSHFAERPRAEMHERLLRNRRPLVAGLAVAVALMAGFGDVAVRILYSGPFEQAGWMLAVLSIGLWPRMLANTSAPALLAIAKPGWFAAASSIQLAWLVGALPAASMLFGMPGIVWAIALGGVPSWAIEAWALRKNGLSTLRQDFGMTFLWLATLALCGLLRWSVGLGSPFPAL